MSASVKDNAGVSVEKEKKRKRTLRVDPKQDAPATDGKVETKRIKAEPVTKLEARASQFYLEEEEVESRDVKKDVALFQSACGDIQKCIKDIGVLKKKKGKSATEEIEAKRVEGMLQFIMLKKLNRLAHIRCKKVRDKTNEAKLRVDKKHLQLQNLLYEVMHLEKEITKCLEFKSKDEEIELVPVEQFYKEAPPEITKVESTKSDLHNQTLARLDWELEQRQQLAEKLKEAQKTRETIEDEIKTKQEYLDNLQPKLNNILQATKPVQEYLNVPFDEVREEHQTACFLPPPLYVLYMQTSAYREACDKQLTVKLDGDLDAAKSLDLTTPLADDDSDSDAEDQEVQEKKSSKRRRKTVEKKTEKKMKIMKKHPLSVNLKVQCEDGSHLHLTFSYLIYLRVITVATKVQVASDTATSCVSGGDLLSNDSILNNLYPDDQGDSSPNQANQYELTRFGLKDFSYYIPQLGRPYMWAQWLGGLQFLSGEAPKSPQTSVCSGSIQLTMKKLRQRIKARLSLMKQLTSLERQCIPVASEYQTLFPAKLSAQLQSWKRSTFEDFSALSYAKSVVEAGLAQETDLFFTAVLERNSAKLTAHIVMGPDYPSVAPLFVINIRWHSADKNANNSYHIQELEEEVNVYYNELVQKSRDQLLTNQLQRLLMCFDVYLETESQTLAKEGHSEITKEKVFTRITRGPQRTKPYKYCPEIGIFTHR